MDLLRVLFAVKSHYDLGNSQKRKPLLGLAYSFRGLAHYPHGEEHGDTQTDMVAESSTSGSKGSKERATLGWNGLFEPEHPPRLHTSSNKVTSTQTWPHSQFLLGSANP